MSQLKNRPSFTAAVVNIVKKAFGLTSEKPSNDELPSGELPEVPPKTEPTMKPLETPMGQRSSSFSAPKQSSHAVAPAIESKQAKQPSN